jgi:hypothetical protein
VANDDGEGRFYLAGALEVGEEDGVGAAQRVGDGEGEDCLAVGVGCAGRQDGVAGDLEDDGDGVIRRCSGEFRFDDGADDAGGGVEGDLFLGGEGGCGNGGEPDDRGCHEGEESTETYRHDVSPLFMWGRQE